MATYTEHYNLKKPQPSEYYAIADFNGNADVIDDELFKKVDKVSGKGLSTNDYTNADKSIVDGVTSALAGKVDKVTGKGLSTNDYDNTAKGIVDGVTSALAGKVDTSLVGSANGVAELDANGRVPSSQLPSYVDDVLEYADLAHFPATGETGKIYIAVDTNKEYRWSGSGYVVISESLALGETSSTAYAGNKGKANADAIAGIKNGTSINSFGAVETALAGKASTNDLGDKSNLTTTDKSSCVGAINEVNGKLTKTQSVVSIDSTYYDAGTDWNIVKQGNICVLNMRNLKDIPVGETVIGTIPVGFRPELPFYEFAYIIFNDVHLGFRIGENGEITCVNQTGASISGTIYVNRNVTYFTA